MNTDDLTKRALADVIADSAIGCRNCGDTWERPVSKSGVVAACEDCGDAEYSLAAATTSPKTPVGSEAHYLPNWLWCGRCKAWIETAHQCGAQYIDKGTHFELVKPAASVVAAGDDEGEHPEDFCKKCGRPNIVWFAPNEIWNQAVRAANEPEILCPVCFVELAEAAGFQSAWRVAPGDLK